MAQLVVGGVTIPVARGNASRDRDDFTDRRRAFDGTYRASQTGGAARTWRFRTPPITRALADTYEATLGIVAAQMCSGDLLGIPTMCCAQIDSGWNAIKAASGHYVELPFTLHEVQPAKLLLKYAPGDTITGSTFTRSTVGYSINQSGVLVSSAIDVKRDSHYIGGVRSLLLEDARISSILWASDLSNAAWTKGSMSVGTGIADPTGGTGAVTLTATGANAFAEQTLATGSNIVRTNSVWLKRRTGTGTIQVAAPSTGFTTVVLTGSWQRFAVVGTSAINRYGAIKIITSADAVDVFIFDQDDASFESSERQTTTAAFTRGADSYSLPFTESPKEMTVYVKLVEKGTILTASARVLSISNSSGTAPRLLIYNAGANYAVDYDNSSASVASSAPGTPALGNTVELMARLFGDGSVDITQSINGAAATIGTQSGPQAAGIVSPWSGQLAWLNSVGSSAVGFNAFISLKVVAGARSLTEMRAA